MPYDYRILKDHDLLVITGSDEVSSADIYRVVTAFQRDPDWHSGMNMLVDWRRVTELNIDLDEVRRLAADALDEEQMEKGTPLGPRAAVLISDHDHEMIPRLYSAYLRRSGLETRVFFKAEEAAEWVGVPAEVALRGGLQ